MSHRSVTPRNDRPLRAWIVHALRVAIFCGIVGSIYLHSRVQRATENPQDIPPDVLREILLIYGTEPVVVKFDAQNRHIVIRNMDHNLIGSAVMTSPEADSIIGFSGPTNVMLAFDINSNLVSIKILSSKETREHVAAVRDSAEFWNQLTGKSWTELSSLTEVDAVSGATLTSLAIGESIVHRLGGRVPNLRFPDEITVEDVRPLFAAADELVPVKGPVTGWRVLNEEGNRIGSVLSTSPVADDIVGYQGPTQTLVGIDQSGNVTRIHLHRSYDNEPYTEYPAEDWTFPELFAGLSLEDVAKLDLKNQGVEGVSGATWTSMAIARAVIQTAAIQVEEPSASKMLSRSAAHKMQMTWLDGTALLLVTVGVILSWTHLRGIGWLRIVYQLCVIVFLGFINGDLLSQALFVGWAEHGIPWQTATRLATLAGVAFTFPVIGKRNVYCSHLCAYGAAQQLIKKRIPHQLHLGMRVRRILTLLPSMLLICVVIIVMRDLTFSLVDLEPFDAFLFWIAGPVATSIFVVGLLASLFIPMAYCRFGCPTGQLLEYLRRTRRSDQLGWSDALAGLLLVLAVWSI